MVQFDVVSNNLFSDLTASLFGTGLVPVTLKSSGRGIPKICGKVLAKSVPFHHRHLTVQSAGEFVVVGSITSACFNFKNGAGAAIAHVCPTQLSAALEHATFYFKNVGSSAERECFLCSLTIDL